MRRGTKSLTAGVVLSLALAGAAVAQDKTARIGVLSDMSGIYADVAGINSVLAIEMAIEDSGLLAEGWRVELLSGDHQNKPDVASNLARNWIDNHGVGAIVTTGNSAIALAINVVAREKNVVLLNSGAAAVDLTGKACSPNTISFSYDTYMLTHSTGSALIKAGGNSWFLIAADYSFGRALENEIANLVSRDGGRLLGSVRHPTGMTDFSSYLLQAEASGAKVIGLADAGGDATNALKQASEFGIASENQKVAALLLLISDVHGLGLRAAQGLLLTESFYWDMNASTRAWSERFAKRAKGHVMPSMAIAGNYAVVLHYLKSLKTIGGDPHAGIEVVARMKAIPAEDPLYGRGEVRADGRRLMPAYLFQVKAPDESKYPWDYYRLVATTPAAEAAIPLGESACPLVKR